MRIALVMGPCPPGSCGVGDYSLSLAKALRECGHQVDIVADDGWGIIDALRKRKVLRALNSDVVHIQYPTLGFGAKLGPQALALLLDSIVTIHEASQVHILRKLALYAFTVRPKHIIFTSDYERRFAVRWAPWISRRSSVIPIGNTIQVHGHESKRESAEIVYFGLIRPRKGIENILQLGSLIQSTCLPLKIRIIGRPHANHLAYFERLRSESKTLPILWDHNLQDEEIATRLAQACVGYLPFPDGVSERRSTLKALLANGIAVVTTRGMHTPVNVENVVKFAGTPGEALAVIRSLIDNPSERKKLSDKALKYMEEFSWGNIAKLHSQIYERIASAKQTP